MFYFTLIISVVVFTITVKNYKKFNIDSYFWIGSIFTTILIFCLIWIMCPKVPSSYDIKEELHTIYEENYHTSYTAVDNYYNPRVAVADAIDDFNSHLVLYDIGYSDGKYDKEHGLPASIKNYEVDYSIGSISEWVQ